ncbi:hypothetical protein MRX96_039014 [Rhipicephalus microplus]
MPLGRVHVSPAHSSEIRIVRGGCGMMSCADCRDNLSGASVAGRDVVLFPTGLARSPAFLRLEKRKKQNGRTDSVDRVENWDCPPTIGEKPSPRAPQARRRLRARCELTGPPSVSRRAPLAICHDSESSSGSGARRQAGRLCTAAATKRQLAGRCRAKESGRFPRRERQQVFLFLSVPTFAWAAGCRRTSGGASGIMRRPCRLAIAACNVGRLHRPSHGRTIRSEGESPKETSLLSHFLRVTPGWRGIDGVLKARVQEDRESTTGRRAGFGDPTVTLLTVGHGRNGWPYHVGIDARCSNVTNVRVPRWKTPHRAPCELVSPNVCSVGRLRTTPRMSGASENMREIGADGKARNAA